MRHIKNLESRFDSIETEKALAGQLPQNAGEFAGAIGLAQKSPAFGQILFPDIHKA